MTFSDYVVIAGLGLMALGAAAVGYAIRIVATGVDEAIGLYGKVKHA